MSRPVGRENEHEQEQSEDWGRERLGRARARVAETVQLAHRRSARWGVRRLIAIHDDRIQRVTVTIAGSSDRQRRALASRLARHVFARLDG